MTQLHFGAGRDLTINIGEPIAVQQGTGVYNIAGCQIGQDVITNLWEDDNTG